MIMRIGKKRKKVLELYANDPSLDLKSLAYRSGCSEQYATKVIQEYHRDMVSYYHLCLAPAVSEPQKYYLFNDNGMQKTLRIQDNVVICDKQLTNLEALFVQINLGKKIDAESLSKIFN